MFVYQVMSTHVVAVRPEDSADQAAGDLIEREITGLPGIANMNAAARIGWSWVIFADRASIRPWFYTGREH